jgi:hypothetical protein
MKMRYRFAARFLAENIITEIYKVYENTPAPYSANPWIDSMIKKSNIPLPAEIQTSPDV